MFLTTLLNAIIDIFKPKKNKRPPEKIKDEQIPKKVRDSVWNKYHKEKNIGICYTCGISIERYNAGWHCSHVLARNKGGSIDVENLRTCCKHCNLSMGNCNLYTFIKNKNLKGPGRRHMDAYFAKNKSQINDKRTNNWGKNTI